MEQPRLHLYTIDMKYVRNLSNADKNIMSTSPQLGKVHRPFVGILVLLNNKTYCIPLTSPKEKFEGKKNSIDFIKILHPTSKNENGAFKVIGALNLNNMIPVDISVLQKIDLQIRSTDTPKTVAYKELMKDQLSWCQANQDIILKRANQLYDVITKYPEKNRNLVRRCCNFLKLEAVLERYIQSKGKQNNSKAYETRQKSTSPLSLKAIKKNTEIISKKHQQSKNPDKTKKPHEIE